MAQAASTVTIIKQRDGNWAFVLTYRGVTQPAHGRFATQLQAQAAGMAAMKALDRKA